MNCTRREFLQRSAAVYAGTLIPAPLAAMRTRAEPVFRELRRNVGIYTNRGGTIGWVNTLDGAAIVDSQYPEAAEALRPELANIGARPFHALINTHHHPDHTEGNKNLRYGSRVIVAHENSAANQKKSAEQLRTEAAQEYPDTTFVESWGMDLGDERIRAKYYGPAHTNGDIAITFERANVVHLGDLVINRGHPQVDAAYGGSVHGWVRVLEQVLADHTADTLYIFGHSEGGRPVTGSPADVSFQRDYLAAVVEVAGRAVRDGRSRAEVSRIQSLPGITGVSGNVAWLGETVGVAYDEVRAGATR